MEIVIGSKSEAAFTRNDVVGMHRLRYRVFRERLQWEVPHIEGLESDEFDREDTVYMLVRSGEGEVCGCWRLLPTTASYMLRDTFADLLNGQEAPCDSQVWELSRFALKASDKCAHRFSDATLAMLERVIEYGLAHGVRRYVTVTTTAIERMIARLGLPMRRFGPPQVIGRDRVVAFSIEIDEAVLGSVRAALDPQRPEERAAA